MRSIFKKYISVDDTMMAALTECQIILTHEVIHSANRYDKELLYEIATKYYEMKKYSQAFIWYRKSSTKSSSAAQNMVGEMYFHGKGVSKSDRLAMEWFLSAHYTDGNKRSQYNIGLLYQYGYGVKIDLNTAAEWYIKSANQGYHIARTCLNSIYSNCAPIASLEEDTKRYQKPGGYSNNESKGDLKQLHNEVNYLNNEHKESQNVDVEKIQLLETKHHTNHSIKKNVTRKPLPLQSTNTKNGFDFMEEKKAKDVGYVRAIQSKLSNIEEMQDKMKAKIKEDAKKIETIELALANFSLNYNKDDEHN